MNWGKDGGIAVCVCIVSCFIYHIILRILSVRLSHGKHIIVMGKNVIIRIAIHIGLRDISWGKRWVHQRSRGKRGKIRTVVHIDDLL